MTSVGERLRAEREVRDWTIEQIAEATGIGAHFLEAMEQNDLNALPGRAFGKLYIRAYAEALQFDPTSLIEDYDREQRLLPEETKRSTRWRPAPGSRGEAENESPRETTVVEPAVATETAASVRTPRSKRGLVAALAAGGLALVAAIGFGFRGSPPTAPTVTSKVSSPELAPAPAPAPAPARATLPTPTVAPVVAARRPAPSPSRAQSSPGHLSVTESGVGRRVVDSRLEGERDRFAPGDVACFWTRVVGGRSGETIRHVWSFEGRVQQSIALRLDGSDWRTYSAKTLYKPGAWTVEARDEAGGVLATAVFTCEGNGR